MIPPTIKESALLSQCKSILNQLKSFNLLTFRRIHVVPIPTGRWIAGKPNRYRKNMDMVGMPDMIVAAKGKIIYLELKNPKSGRLSPEQKEFISDWANHGIETFVIKSMNDLYSALDKGLGVSPWDENKRVKV